MIQTVNTWVSDVRNELKALTLDDYISPRYIYSRLLTVADAIIRREGDSRRLFQQAHLYLDLPEVALAPVPTSEITQFATGSLYMMQTPKLPVWFNTNYGNTLTVYSLDGFTRYSYIKPASYRDILRRRYQPTTQGYYWFHDGSIVLPRTDVESISINGIFVSEYDVQEFNGTLSHCQKRLDSRLMIPDSLRFDVIRLTVEAIRQSKAIPDDELPNLNNLQKTTQQAKS